MVYTRKRKKSGKGLAEMQDVTCPENIHLSSTHRPHRGPSNPVHSSATPLSPIPYPVTQKWGSLCVFELPSSLSPSRHFFTLNTWPGIYKVWGVTSIDLLSFFTLPPRVRPSLSPPILPSHYSHHALCMWSRWALASSFFGNRTLSGSKQLPWLYCQ